VVIYAPPSVYEYDISKAETQGIRVKVLATRRIHHEAMDPQGEDVELLEPDMAKLEAWDSGYHDGVNARLARLGGGVPRLQHHGSQGQQTIHAVARASGGYHAGVR